MEGLSSNQKNVHIHKMVMTGAAIKLYGNCWAGYNRKATKEVQRQRWKGVLVEFGFPELLCQLSMSPV